MAASILAHQKQTLRYVADIAEFVEDDSGDWTIQSLDYFEAQRTFAIDNPVEAVRLTIELALLTVPNGTVAEFLACPAAALMQPLYTAIWKHTKGN